MPETFLIERYKFDAYAYELYLSKGGRNNPDITKEVIDQFSCLANEWWTAFRNLSNAQKNALLQIIGHNIFTDEIIASLDPECKEVIKYYLIKRHSQSTNTSNK